MQVSWGSVFTLLESTRLNLCVHVVDVDCVVLFTECPCCALPCYVFLRTTQEQILASSRY